MSNRQKDGYFQCTTCNKKCFTKIAFEKHLINEHSLILQIEKDKVVNKDSISHQDCIPHISRDETSNTSNTCLNVISFLKTVITCIGLGDGLNFHYYYNYYFYLNLLPNKILLASFVIFNEGVKINTSKKACSMLMMKDFEVENLYASNYFWVDRRFRRHILEACGSSPI